VIDEWTAVEQGIADDSNFARIQLDPSVPQGKAHDPSFNVAVLHCVVQVDYSVKKEENA
jgi:hypothetical protein